MTVVPPPQGLTESDYETIEAAVTETVRGRWFLGEFARRNRAVEMRQLLDAIGRLESSVVANQAALPSADPSVRLLIQRIKEVAGHLDGLADEMQEAGVEEHFAEAVKLQARAVAGMMRGGPAVAATPSPKPLPPAEPPKAALRMPRANLPAALTAPRPAPVASEMPPAPPQPSAGVDDDPRLAALSGLDRLTLAEKLALFS